MSAVVTPSFMLWAVVLAIALLRAPEAREVPSHFSSAAVARVNSQGKSTYITEGELRASHRMLSPAPFENLGLPWFNHFQSELRPSQAENRSS